MAFDNEKKINELLVHTSSYLIAIFTTVVIVVFFFSFLSYEKMDDTTVIRINRETATEATTKAYYNNANSTSFVECKNFDIKRLMKSYYEALSNGSTEELSKYVDDVSGFDDRILYVNQRYVEAYMDIQCYYMEGMMPGTYLVAAYSYVKYYNANRTAPNLDLFYICENASGLYYISKVDNGDEISSYNELMFENSQIVQMQNMAEQELEDAISEDMDLNQIIRNIKLGE